MTRRAEARILPFSRARSDDDDVIINNDNDEQRQQRRKRATPTERRLARWLFKRLGMAAAVPVVKDHGARRVLEALYHVVEHTPPRGHAVREHVKRPAGMLLWLLKQERDDD